MRGGILWRKCSFSLLTGNALLEDDKVFHLVRPADELDEIKSKRGSIKDKSMTKAITEIYLTRLLSVKVQRQDLTRHLLYHYALLLTMKLFIRDRERDRGELQFELPSVTKMLHKFSANTRVTCRLCPASHCLLPVSGNAAAVCR